MNFRTALIFLLCCLISFRALSFLSENDTSDYYAEILGADVGNDTLIKKKASSFIISSFLDVPWVDESYVDSVFKQEDAVVLLIKNSNSLENHQMIPFPSEQDLEYLGGVAVSFSVEALDVDGDGVLDFIVDDNLVGNKTLYSGVGDRDMTSIRSTLTTDSIATSPIEYFPVETVKPIKGNASVDAFGNATYGLSLELPKSPTGLTPNIGVSYNSAGGYGNLGMGWSLSSIPVISRCTDNYDRNPTPVPIKHLDTDQFCLNGKYIDGDTSQGQGQLEVDDFRRIKRTGSGSTLSWTVYDTSGYTTIYKSFLDGVIFLPYEKFETGHPENKIVYTYLDQDKEVSLSRIDYAYSNEGNKFSVDINYHEGSAGRYEKYIAGKSFKTGRLVNSVIVKGSGKAINEYHFFYDSISNNSAFVSKLKGIQQCGFKYVGFQRVCGEPLELVWHDDHNSLNFYDFFDEEIKNEHLERGIYDHVLVDLNGDGSKETVNSQSAIAPIYRYDNNKDAYLKLVYIKLQSFKVNLRTVTYVHLGENKNDKQIINYKLYKWAIVHSGKTRIIDNACLWLPAANDAEKYLLSSKGIVNAISYDANGDGVNELGVPGNACQQNNDTVENGLSAKWYEYSRGVGESEFKFVKSLDTEVFKNKVVPCEHGRYKCFQLEIKDGMVVPMKLFSSPGVSLVAKSTKYNYWKVNNERLHDVNRIQIPAVRSVSGDYNGDGLTDIVAAHFEWDRNGYRTEKWMLYLNKGDGEETFNKGILRFSAPVEIGFLLDKKVTDSEFDKKRIPDFSQTLKTQIEVRLLDVTGDNLQDFLLVDAEREMISVCPQINGRIDNSNCLEWVNAYSEKKGEWNLGTSQERYELKPNLIEFADVNSDGVIDLVSNYSSSEEYLAPDEVYGQYVRFGKKRNSGVVNKINGIDKNEFYYLPLTQLPSYIYTNEEYIGPKSVVTSRKYTANNDAVATKTYTYKNGKLNYQGRGFLGFETINVKDSLTGFDVFSMYSWQFDRVGKPNYVRKSKNGAIVSSVLNTWLDDCNCSWLSRTDSKKYELKEGSASQTVPYLNVTKEYNRGASNELTSLVTKYQEAQGDLVTLKTIEDIYVYDYINKDKALIKQPSNSRRVINNHILNDKLSSKFKSNSNWVNRQYSIVSNTYSPELENGVAKSNRILKTEVNDHDYNLKLTSEFDYNEYGVLLKTTTSGDSRAKHPIETRSTGIVEAFGFTDGLYPNATKDALGNVTKYSYHPSLGTVASITDPNGVVSRKQYGEFGYEVSSSTENQPTIESFFGYCSTKGSVSCNVIGFNLTEINKLYSWQKNTSSDGTSLTRYYDKKGTLILTKKNDFNSVLEHTKYDALGRKVAVSMPYKQGQTPYYSTFAEFDIFNRANLVIKANGHKIESGFKLAAGTNTRVNTTKQTLYKADGSLDRILTHEQRLNPLGQVKWVMGPLESVSDERLDAYYRYDGMGNMNGALLFPGGGPASVGGTSSAVAADKHIQIDSNYDTAGNRIYLKDPSLGESFSKYDALGQLRYTLKGAAATDETPHDWTSRSYDLLGRMVQRDEQAWQGPFKSSHWYFDHSPECDLASQIGQLNVVGGLCKKTDGTFVERYAYNKNGQKTYQQTDAGYKEPFIFAYDYNDLGQLATETYPSKNTVKYNYSKGELANVSDDNGLLFTNLARDAFGNTVHRQYKNRLILKHRYDPKSGLPVLHAQRNNGVGNQLSWNSAGWLTKSKESWGSQTALNVATLSETDYGYDNYGRITAFTTNDGGENRAYSYDVLGNLETITKGRLTIKNLYEQINGASPNAATGLMQKIDDGEYRSSGSGYEYDFKGNLKKAGLGSYRYTAFNKPYSFHDGSIAYGPDHQRYKWTKKNGDITYYINGGRYEMNANKNNYRTGVVEHMPGGIDFNGNLNSGNRAYDYLVKDHLGSTTLIYNYRNLIANGRGYYPFGGSYQSKVFAVSDLETFQVGRLNYNPRWSNKKTRGFTGHEHMPGFINMNGRNFNQSNGRFNSADPMLQDPFNPQNFNRYSYVLNSPMGATDPSGYVLWNPFTWDWSGNDKATPRLPGEGEYDFFNPRSPETLQNVNATIDVGSEQWNIYKGIAIETANPMTVVDGALESGMTGIANAAAKKFPAVKLGSAIVEGFTKGGRYGKVRYRNDGGEVHHMPANSVNGLPHSQGPSIHMSKADHKLTASHGNQGLAGAEYRAKQKELIDSGRFDDAIQMDIDDIQGKFGNKYDDAILQMIDSLD